MTVKELIEKLQEFDGDLTVYYNDEDFGYLEFDIVKLEHFHDENKSSPFDVVLLDY